MIAAMEGAQGVPSQRGTPHTHLDIFIYANTCSLHLSRQLTAC